MKNLIEAFPQNIKDAAVIGKAFEFQTPKNEVKNIIICGLGGSGIGGRIVKSFFVNEFPVPIECIADYSLPAYVNEKTLVILVHMLQFHMPHIETISHLLIYPHYLAHKTQNLKNSTCQFRHFQLQKML